MQTLRQLKAAALVLGVHVGCCAHVAAQNRLKQIKRLRQRERQTVRQLTQILQSATNTTATIKHGCVHHLIVNTHASLIGHATQQWSHLVIRHALDNIRCRTVHYRRLNLLRLGRAEHPNRALSARLVLILQLTQQRVLSGGAHTVTLVNNDNLQPGRHRRPDRRVANQIADGRHVRRTSRRDHALRTQRVTLSRLVIVHGHTRIALAARVVAGLNVLTHEGARHDIGERRLTAPGLAAKQEAMRVVRATGGVSGPGFRHIRANTLHCRILADNLIERSRPIRRRQIGDLAAIHRRIVGVAGCCFLRCHYSVNIFLHQ